MKENPIVTKSLCKRGRLMHSTHDISRDETRILIEGGGGAEYEYIYIYIVKMQITIHLALTNYQCANMQLEKC